MKVVASVSGMPQPADAGVVAIIPDGGILPKPSPEAVVFDSDGSELYSETVWANPREGFAVAFATPKGNEVAIYLKSGGSGGAKKKESPLKPGLLLFTEIGGANLERAESIGKQSPPGKEARMGMVGRIGHRENLMGNDDDYVSFYTGWLKIPKDEKIFFCTVSDEGSTAKIDGKTIASWPGIHTREGGAKGEHGNDIELSAGFHKIEYAHFEKSGPQEANFCWRTGLDPASAKTPVTVPEKIFTHSAPATIKDIRYRDGRVPPMFSATPVSYLWLNDKPLCLYRLTMDQPDAVPSFSWRIGDYESTEKELNWIVAGDGETTATLVFSQEGKSVAMSRPLYLPTTPRNASVNSANDRRDYRQALLTRCLATPKSSSPCARWDADMWATLAAVVEPYAGNALLEQIMTRARSDLGRRPSEERWTLEDLFIENMRYTSPATVLPWMEKLEQTETDATRKFIWQKRRFQFFAYDMGDLGKAQAAVDTMRAMAGTPEAIARMLICAGDMERFRGNFEQAQKYYIDAADHYRQVRQKTVVKPTSGAPVAGDADWRIGAVRDGAYARQVDNLIAQSDWLGARRELDKWEREFPLSKMSGDFNLAEARYYFRIRDYKRAQVILSTSRKALDSSPSLPDAMQMEFECLMQLDRGSEAAELAVDAEKRFPGHAVIEYMRTRANPEFVKKVRELQAAPKVIP